MLEQLPAWVQDPASLNASTLAIDYYLFDEGSVPELALELFGFNISGVFAVINATRDQAVQVRALRCANHCVCSVCPEARTSDQAVHAGGPLLLYTSACSSMLCSARLAAHLVQPCMPACHAPGSQGTPPMC